MIRSNWTYVIILVLAILLGFYFYNKYKVSPDLDFSKLALQNLQGEAFQFETLKGKKLIVAFAASWCGNCREELGDLLSIYSNRLNNVEIVVISDETPDRITDFKNSKKYPFTFLRLMVPFTSLAIQSIPTTYLLNQNLQVKKQQVGFINWKDPSTSEHLIRLMD